ncbi:MAG: hypothetical protein AB7O26_01310 [Planctomycetaceae bacterium]
MNDEPLLRLPKTRLMCGPGLLAKYDKLGTISARYPLRSIVDIRAEKVRELAIPILVCLTFAAIAVVSWIYIESSFWKWFAVCFCIGIMGFSLFGLYSDKIVIETQAGAVTYSTFETTGEVQGFALSVKLLASPETPVGRWRGIAGDNVVLVEFESGPIEGLYKQIVERNGQTVREFGHWFTEGGSLQLLIMASDVRSHPRFGIDTKYEIEYLDVDHIRINGPDRENLELVRTWMELTGFEDVAEASEQHTSDGDPHITSKFESPYSATPPQS